ncbi:hypothetical protein MKZ38_004896 [Zalerion maritima]|uniref:25S rRNA adenine-N(1) methyltransferase n=1 Tax=Zalerion maritima TaxID=339359 RepID=A0AAD5RY99_9PEZI|nr:hypothetical protein MKZ38_004896 [Zalerion maritima]
MGAGNRKRRKDAPKRLSHGRPPVFQKQQKTLSSKTTKTLINRHHVLEKKRKQAVLKKDQKEVDIIESELASLGGIEAYQRASLQGQRNDRGGDSSKLLMEWLRPAVDTLKRSPLRLLEVGALSTDNACSKSLCFGMERIDLNSQGEGILQQDFMARPLPRDDSERFDIISLSLVLNFVPNAKDRGKMLWRTLAFLRQPDRISPKQLGDFFPSLFLVLPAPCITNSRYTDEQQLGRIMTSLGYTKTQHKSTNKLIYYLWRRVPISLNSNIFLGRKTEIRSGASRNNFSILLDAAWPSWPVTASAAALPTQHFTDT